MGPDFQFQPVIPLTAEDPPKRWEIRTNRRYSVISGVRRRHRVLRARVGAQVFSHVAVTHRSIVKFRGTLCCGSGVKFTTNCRARKTRLLISEEDESHGVETEYRSYPRRVG